MYTDSGRIDVVVEMGFWAEAAANQTIGTFALGPCIGVALFDPGSKNGFMAHSVGAECATFDMMIKHVSGQVKNRSALLAWVSGGGIDSEYERSLIEQVRSDTLAILAIFGIDQEETDVEWGPGSYMSSDMVLDCETGQCEISHTSPSFDFEWSDS